MAEPWAKSLVVSRVGSTVRWWVAARAVSKDVRLDWMKVWQRAGMWAARSGGSRAASTVDCLAEHWV